MAELAFAYESLTQEKRVKALPPSVAGEFMFHAAEFFGDCFGDDYGAIKFLERTLELMPSHDGAFDRLEAKFVETGDHRKLADLYTAMAQVRPRAEQAQLLKRAAQVLARMSSEGDRVSELLLQVLRLDAGDEEARLMLEQIYTDSGKIREIVRILEQGLLVTDPPPGMLAALHMRTRLIELYTNELGELERSTPHIEALLAIDPKHQLGRAVAEKLLEVKGVAARAAAALSEAYAIEGNTERVERYLAIELEHTRGSKRRDVLRRLGIIRQDMLGNPAGAFDAIEQALSLDPADDELRARYVTLAIQLGKQLDAARTLTKISTTAKDASVRARLTASMGELYFSGGDKKRARAVFTSAMAMPDAPDDAILVSARSLVEIYDAEGETKPLPDLLDRLSQVETDPERARVVNERLGDIAMAAKDPVRAATAWRRVLDTSSRPRALAALEKIYENDENVENFAFILEERAKDAPPNEARALLTRTAIVLTDAGKYAERAIAVWRRLIENYGPTREIYLRYIPLLESRGQWAELAAALAQDAELAQGAERGALLARSGAIALQRVRNVPAAIEAFGKALTSAPGDKTARGTLEKLLAAGDHRVAAASALEPIYRNEESLTGILRVLEVKASLSLATDERLAALDEATRVAAASQQHRVHALDFAGRGLAEATAADEPLESWIERVLFLSRDGEVKRKAALFAKALGDRPVDNQSIFLLATHAGDALAAAGDVQAALAVYRRALAYDPSSTDLLNRVDTLLRDQGSPQERVQLYASALERETDLAQRRRLLHAIGALSRHELNDKSTAIQAYRAALNDDPEDRDAFAALSELFTEVQAWPNLVALLEEQLRTATGRDSLVLRSQIAEVAATSEQPLEAAMHCGAILGDPLVETADLDVIERVAEKIGDVTLLAASLERRASLAGEPDDAIAALDRLGAIYKDQQANTPAAIETWLRAAKLAAESNELDSACRLYERVRKIAPNDADATESLVAILETQEKWSALPELYGALIDAASNDAARVHVLLRLANVLGEKLGDPSTATSAAMRAFAVDPKNSESLATFEKLAIVAGATAPFARSVDTVLSKLDLEEPLAQDLMLAKARVFYKDRGRHDDAAGIYRELLLNTQLDPNRRQAASTAFQKLLDTAEQTDARKEDRRWLLAWRAARAQTDEEKVLALLACARAEESVLDDAERALATHKRVLEIDPENAEASAAVARLTLASGDVGGAIAALLAQRERADGAARRALDLEISTILIERGEQLDNAMQSLSALLDEAADDADAIALISRLIRVPSERDQAVAALEKARSKAENGDARALILSTLVGEEAAGSVDERSDWFDQLVKIQREQGKGEAALLTALRALDEHPNAFKLWDTAEELARELKTPGGVADAYLAVIGKKLLPDEAMELGQRAVSFHEEWFDDAARIVNVLERVLTIDPAADWAFDRLKLLFDAREQWDEMFGLYDRAIASAAPARKLELLDDAAQIAKDFANHSERAIGYLEQLLALKPKNARITASLERLYERHGRHRELIALLSAQLPSLGAKEARETRVRIAQMSLEDLHDPAAALAVVEEVLAPDPRESPAIAVLGEPTNAMRVQVVGILERILAVAPLGQETRESMLPPPSEHSVSDRPPRESVIPPRSRAKKTPVRQRTAALLKEHYLQTERDADLAKVLEVELEAIKSVKERIRRHRQIAELYVKLGLDASALEHYVALVTLDPDEVGHREALARIGAKVGRYDRVAEVLTAAAEDCTDESVRVDLFMQAALVHEERLSDATRAIELYLRVLGAPDVSADALLAASRRLDPLLETADRQRERLNVLERISELEQETAPRRRALGAAAHLAAKLGEHERAIAAWEICLAIDPTDGEALDGLVSLLEQDKRWKPLVEALARRAKAAKSAADRRADRVHIAHIYNDDLKDAAAAIGAWHAIEEEFGADDESTSALAAMLRSTERWAELGELLHDAAKRASSNETRATLLRQLGDVQRERLNDATAALKNYEEALAADPNEPGALAGAQSLLDNADHRAEAVRVLLATYEATGAWQPALDLTEHRLLATQDSEAQMRILKEAANLAETRAEDLPAAYSYVCRAFAIAPHDAEAETALFRLAEAVDGWRAFADVHRATIDKLESALHAVDASAPIPKRQAELLTRLRIHLGSALERRLDDPRGALNAYMRAAADSPHDLEATLAAVRVAGPAGRWDAAAKVIVHHAMATGELVSELFTELETVATTPAAWDGITGAFAAAIAERSDLLPHIGRELEARVAEWHRDRRGDPDGAESAFARALTHDPSNAELLGALAQLQRRAKGRPLVDSLLRLSQATGGDLDLLREAAEIATSAIADRALAKSILERLLRLATDRWVGTAEPNGVTSGGASGPDSYARWAVDELVRIYNEEGDAEKIVDLLVEAARLPFELDTTRAMLHQAARVSVDRLGDLDRAIGLFGSLFDSDTADANAARELVILYGQLGRREELLALREKQISIATDSNDRIALRLEAARLQSDLRRSDASIETLRANLREEPRHPQTVDALVDVLTGRKQNEELATLLADQAQLAEASSDSLAALNFWASAANVAEQRLGDTDAAMTYFSRVVAIGPNAAALDALSRLSLARQDFSGAADYLTQLRECVPDHERPSVTLRLADALVSAGREDLARARLEDAMSSHPKAEELRTRLATMYREKKDYRALATLLAQGAAHASSKEQKLERLREAAELYRGEVAAPELAIPLLEEACAQDPEDRPLKLELADTMGAAGKVSEARALLRALIDEFGGRRPKERAPVHYHLARLDLRAGDHAQAVSELEAATRIDPANAEILRALAELARDDGQLERAERSYRALLAVVRRVENPPENAPIVRSEALLELSDIAKRQGETERAEEILESALEAAAGHPVEGSRLERALRKRGDFVTLAKAIEAQLARAQEPAQSVAKMIELADVFATQLDRAADAFTMALRAVDLAPQLTSAHDAAIDLAKKVPEGNARYITAVETLISAAESNRDTKLAGALLLRLGTTIATELHDDARAVAMFERAENLPGGDAGEVLRSLEQLYERTENRAGQERVLARLVDFEQHATPREPGKVADALLRLAALRLTAPDGADEACSHIQSAVILVPPITGRIDPIVERATHLLEKAAEVDPSKAVLDLYESVARRSGSQASLLAALRTRAIHGRATGATMREGVMLARDLADAAAAEDILRRYIAIATESDDEKSHAAWAHLTLADVLEERGEGRDAVTHRLEGAKFSTPEDARRIRFNAAQTSITVAQDLALAAKIYDGLREEAPDDRAAWEPLIDLYRQLNDRKQLAWLLHEIVNYAADDEERMRFRIERAQLLLAIEPASEEGATELRSIVEDDPSQEEAASTLATLLESTGREDDLAALLRRLLDAAKDHENAAQIGSISTRLGKLVEKTDAAEAIEIYRAALEWNPKSEPLLRALYKQVLTNGDANDRAEVGEKLLDLERGPDAEKLALELAQTREEMWDTEGVERVLALGYRGHPGSEVLRDRLMTIYGERGDWKNLAEVYVLDSSAREDATEKSNLLREAAKLYRMELKDPERAAALMKEARVASPQDPTLFEELVSALTEAGNYQGAAAELTAAATRLGETDPARAPLLAERARLRSLLGDQGGALYDLERAFALDPKSYSDALAAQLGVLRQLATEEGDEPKAAALVLRLTELLTQTGREEEARGELMALLERSPDNKDALAALADLEERSEQWAAASETYARLAALAEGADLGKVAIKLANACEKAGDLPRARAGLERANLIDPRDEAVREKLREVYEKSGAARELAEMSLDEAREATDDETRHALLVRGASVLLKNEVDPEVAFAAMTEARALKPADIETAGLLADALLSLGRHEDAADQLRAILASHKGKRIRDLSMIHYRLALIERARGDRKSEITWLSSGLDMDGQNGVVATELAEVAIELGQLDAATKGLRAITMMKTQAPMPRALAYQRLGEIAHSQGDVKKAILLVKRATDEDPNLESARALLQQLKS
jgi:tetratricopeptide (TPR) repeat protein